MDPDSILHWINASTLAGAAALVLFGYLSGSLPFAIWVTRLSIGVDVRDAASRHATTTNTIRQAGFGPGVIVLALDLAKGALPVVLAIRAGAADWLIGLVSAAAVVGHCWPVFAGFRGGMGLAAAGGGYLVVSPLYFVVVLGLLLTLTLLLRHSARAGLFTGVLAAPLLWALGFGPEILWLAGLTGIVLALRFSIDWNRKYRELWLDRDES